MRLEVKHEKRMSLIITFGDIPRFFANEDELRTLWSNPQTRRKLLDGLAEKGYAAQQLRELAKLIQAENSDIFDVLAHVAYAREPITRQQRVVEHQDLIYSHYNDKQQAFLDFVLSNYVRDGIDQLEPDKLGYLLDLKYGGIHDATPDLGEVGAISELFTGFQKHLFADGEEAKEQAL